MRFVVFPGVYDGWSPTGFVPNFVRESICRRQQVQHEAITRQSLFAGEPDCDLLLDRDCGVFRAGGFEADHVAFDRFGDEAAFAADVFSGVLLRGIFADGGVVRRGDGGAAVAIGEAARAGGVSYAPGIVAGGDHDRLVLGLYAAGGDGAGATGERDGSAAVFPGVSHGVAAH